MSYQKRGGVHVPDACADNEWPLAIINPPASVSILVDPFGRSRMGKRMTERITNRTVGGGYGIRMGMTRNCLSPLAEIWLLLLPRFGHHHGLMSRSK